MKTPSIQLYLSLFQARTDVFAIRWQKGKKSGYMPAYDYDPYWYRIHRMKGGTFKDFPNKTFKSLTKEEIDKHIKGEQFIGVYPLLKDNTSWFIVADFDKEGWAEQSRRLIEACSKIDIPAYLERSRSGEGGHVWVFFEKPYPAAKSRRIMTAILEQNGGFSIFEKGESFDRLFPNQDFLSGKGLGNLIALPLNKGLVEEGNNCFIEPESLQPYSNQWTFLNSIQRAPIAQLNKAYNLLIGTGDLSPTGSQSSKLQIRLNHAIYLNRSALTAPLINFLKDELNFANAAFFIKKKTGRNTWDTKRYFKLIQEKGEEIILPRGFIGKLIRYCNQQNLDYEFLDQRREKEKVFFTCTFSLLKHQMKALNTVQKKDFGVIVAPPGSGKTVMGLKIIAEKQQPALIVVHRKQLLEQWVERIESFLRIPRKEIGTIGQGKAKIGKKITVAMIQTLSKKMVTKEDSQWSDKFGLLLVDECHHIPAETFQNTIARFNTYYQYGLTATPFRKYSDGALIFTQLGTVIFEVMPQQIESYKRARIVIRNTDLHVPFNSKTDTFETLSRILVHDTARNQLILGDVKKEIQNGNKSVIITERREHIQTLDQFLKGTYETITLSGEDSEKSRKTKWKLLQSGNFQVVITTGQFFGEGSDLQNVSRLFLAYPFSFKGKLIQYIGRVQRSEIAPVIYDYRDHKIDYLNKLFLKRNKHYRHFDKQATLFDEQVTVVPKNKVVKISRIIKVSIDELDFRYGNVAFTYKDSETAREFEFEIEHEYIRPEFEVLKPYFSKLFGTNQIEVEIYAEIEDGILVAQSATSPALDKINRDSIEGVKFNFVEGLIMEVNVSDKFKTQETESSDSEESKLEKLFHSEEAILEAILQNKNIKHYHQLTYLAKNHDANIKKLRFLLHPFSFVFLLAGNKQFHVVLETLNTEEATYVWHLEKDQRSLSEQLSLVEMDLSTIKNKGRQAFLAAAPKNFSRIIHNYSKGRKGFILWRDTLEERLY